MAAGYYRFPTIHSETIVFVSEDDLWSVPVQGGAARRLTSNTGEVSYPFFSPDGEWLAFVGQEEGATEVYVMPAEGGRAQRLTYLSSRCRVLGWTADGAQIIFSSNYGQVVAREYALFSTPAQGGHHPVTQLPYGPAQSISFGPRGQVVLGRNMGDDFARWKRYRGGTAGHLWIDSNGDGQFQRFLADLPGNIASPMWITPRPAALLLGPERARDGDRIYFASDHEGVGNLYSCLPDGGDLRRHTDHEDYYVRNPTTDGRRIVYHVGADLCVYDLAADQETRVAIDYRSPRVQRNRRFVDPARFLNSATLHPSGRIMALTTRGKLYAFYNHDGPVIQLGKRDGVRYRLPDWLQDQRTIIAVSDELGEETLELHTTNPDEPTRRLEGLDLGRAVDLKVSPVQDKVAIANHRHELLIVDLVSQEVTVADRSAYRLINGFDWSPDGRWLAYSFGATSKTSEIRLFRLPNPDAEDPALRQGAVYPVTRPVLHDVRPSFDPDGRYLYFLSYREFNPVYDSMHFDLGFPWGMRPYLITLRADLPNPFVPHPELEEEEGQQRSGRDEGQSRQEDGRGAKDKEKPEQDETGQDDDDEGDDDGADDGEADDDENQDNDGANDALMHPPADQADAPVEDPITGIETTAPAVGKGEGAAEPAKPQANGAKPLQIDLAGIEQRIIAFPVPDGRYGAIAGIPGKALFTQFPVRGSLETDEEWDDEPPESGTLRSWLFKEFRSETLVENIGWFELSRNRKQILYNSGRRLRVLNAGEKPQTESGPSRRTGWIDLGRVKVSVNPQSEWEQMFREAWRLQRDHFWTEDMADVDWQTVYERYFPLIERVSTRSEFSDLMWEMQGELGTSHAYEMGGDYRWSPYYGQGFLGTQFTWDDAAGGYRVGELVVGDPWDASATSPLTGPGVDVQPGDLLLAINGQRLDEQVSPAQLLVNQAGNEVLLTFAPRTQNAERRTQNTESSGDGRPTPHPPRNRNIVVRAIPSERAARYRAWVEGNRDRVHGWTGGRVGYVHIPDMGARGYAEFHRGYLAEVDRDALIVDVRYNGGGNVSQLILEKLARRRIGYAHSRWGGPMPYPSDSVAGPLVVITNEHAGSDGDIFCHSFKLLKLGPLIGKRTWGGVIGISRRPTLVDGTMTTQPEHSFWFEDVGWNVENYGTDPDIEVDITPQEYAQGQDPQLERAMVEIMRLLEEQPVRRPDLSQRPSRALPKLPPRRPSPTSLTIPDNPL